MAVRIQPINGLDMFLQCNSISQTYPKSSGGLSINFDEPSTKIFVAVEESSSKQKVLGYVQSTMYSEDMVYIEDLVVHKDHTRRGIGGQLINAAIGKNTNCFLHVSTTNRKAMRFCAKMGFLCAATAQLFYGGVEDAYKMVKPNDNLGWLDLDGFDIIPKEITRRA